MNLAANYIHPTSHRITVCIRRAPESRPRLTICDLLTRPHGLAFGLTDGARTRDLRSHNLPIPVSGLCCTLQNRLISADSPAGSCPLFLRIALWVVSAVVSTPAVSGMATLYAHFPDVVLKPGSRDKPKPASPPPRQRYTRCRTRTSQKTPSRHWCENSLGGSFS